ncbi:hypothetical protein AVEN_175748-1 [Araneus ventricosus]|uniref:Reverse transcriptase/retrotransposon-derived protein RNase H-like domain-containing protein n=1 Tax=Araneus ventricosus TaxID=182803 RepID=A0A4Y2M8M3_ARAVE|nr:hypothetical protein AVEN_175748-1 [Araneus ventricosus]
MCFWTIGIAFSWIFSSLREYLSLPERVKAVTGLPQPKTVYELHRFLAMINFYHRFFPRAAHIQTPVFSLFKSKRDKTPINWTQDTLGVFKAYKTLLANAALLAHPKNEASLSLMTNASDFAFAVLYQHVGNKPEPLVSKVNFY